MIVTFFSLFLLTMTSGYVIQDKYDFGDCNRFFFFSTPPSGLPHQQDRHKCICQTLNNENLFSTFYDTKDRLPVFSAYISTRGSNVTEESAEWLIEPQLSDPSADDNMQPPETYVKEKQAFPDDYLKSNYYHIGQLNPDAHNADQISKQGTYSLTNTIPKFPDVNINLWKQFETETNKILSTLCGIDCISYHVTGTLIEDSTIFDQHETERIIVPSLVWSAICIYKPIRSFAFGFGFIILNSELTYGHYMGLEELESLLTAWHASNVTLFRYGCNIGISNTESKDSLSYIESVLEKLSNEAEQIVSFKICRFQLTMEGNTLNDVSLIYANQNNLEIQTNTANRVQLLIKLKNVEEYCGTGNTNNSNKSSNTFFGLKIDSESQQFKSATITTENSNCIDSTVCEEDADGIYRCVVDRNGQKETCCEPEHHCDKYGKDFNWCFTSAEHNWSKNSAYCSTPYSPLTKDGVVCRENHSCGLHGKDYYWCYTDNNNNWEFCCAPGSECKKYGDHLMCNFKSVGYGTVFCNNSIDTNDALLHVNNILDHDNENETMFRYEEALLFGANKKIYNLKGKSCSEGWKYYCTTTGNCNCFKFFDEYVSWKVAENICKLNGSSLTSIHTEEQSKFLTYLKSVATPKTWIGLSNTKLDLRFKWSDQTKVVYTNWAVGHPLGTEESCAYLTDNGWQNEDCAIEIPFICQKEPFNLLPKSSCPKGWTSLCINTECSCYLHSYTKKTWSEASVNCKEVNSELLSVHSIDEMTALKQLTNKEDGMLWIGISTTDDGSFTWSDGSAIDFTIWGSDLSQELSEASCGVIDTGGMQWSLVECTSTTLFYICKIMDSERYPLNKEESIEDLGERDLYKILTENEESVFSVSDVTTTNPLTEEEQSQNLTQALDLVRANTDEQDSGCQQRWKKFCDKKGVCSCYKYFEINLAWLESQNFCENEKANLSSINSAEENQFLDKLTQGDPRLPWIGLKKIGGSFRWVDGLSLTYSNWDDDEPNDQGVEDCSQMRTSGYVKKFISSSSSSGGKWNDFKCVGQSETFFCKKPFK